MQQDLTPPYWHSVSVARGLVVQPEKAGCVIEENVAFLVHGQEWSFTARLNAFADQWIYQWFSDQFTRKWNSTAESRPFVPQPPNTPQNRAPANGSAPGSTTVALRS